MLNFITVVHVTLFSVLNIEFKNKKPPKFVIMKNNNANSIPVYEQISKTNYSSCCDGSITY